MQDPTGQKTAEALCITFVLSDLALSHWEGLSPSKAPLAFQCLLSHGFIHIWPSWFWGALGGKATAMHLLQCAEMLTCLPAASCCSADLLHHSVMKWMWTSAFLTPVSSSHSCYLISCSAGAPCPEIQRQWLVLCALHGCQTASLGRPQPHHPLPTSWQQRGGWQHFISCINTAAVQCSELARRECTTGLYPRLWHPALLPAQECRGTHIQPLILGPSTAFSADLLSYPALTDNGNGLIKKAVDRMNHIFPQASSLALPNEMRLAKRNRPIAQSWLLALCSTRGKHPACHSGTRLAPVKKWKEKAIHWDGKKALGPHQGLPGNSSPEVTGRARSCEYWDMQAML